MRSHGTIAVGETIALYTAVGAAFLGGAISLAAAAELPPRDKDMALISKGEFTMGSSEHSDEAKH